MSMQFQQICRHIWEMLQGFVADLWKQWERLGKNILSQMFSCETCWERIFRREYAQILVPIALGKNILGKNIVSQSFPIVRQISCKYPANIL